MAMSSNVTKLLRVISSKNKLGKNLYENLLNDPSISREIQRKVTLYYKGDKRLSVLNFKETLKKESKKQRGGGGWQIGVVNGVGAIKEICNLEIIVLDNSKQQEPNKVPFMYNDKSYITNNLIGSGAFASVYDTEDGSDFVVKIFKQKNMLDHAKLCIADFMKLFPQITSSYIDGTVEGVSGYVMRKLHPIDVNDETNLLGTFEMAKKMLNECIQEQQSNLNNNVKFIHGDIKIENILLDSKNQNAILTDMDGVIVYNPINLLHVDTNPYDRQIFMTVTCSHPIFPWYTQKLRYFSESAINLSDHMQLWENLWTVIGMNESTILKNVHNNIMTILNYNYSNPQERDGEGFKMDGSYNTFVQSLTNEDLIKKYVTEQLEKIDLYSIGASAICHCVKISLQKSSGQEELINKLYQFAYDTISESLACKPIIVNTKKRLRGGMVHTLVIDTSENMDNIDLNAFNNTIVLNPIK